VVWCSVVMIHRGTPVWGWVCVWGRGVCVWGKEGGGSSAGLDDGNTCMLAVEPPPMPTLLHSRPLMCFLFCPPACLPALVPQPAAVWLPQCWQVELHEHPDAC
jgi:hypothetical protein